MICKKNNFVKNQVIGVDIDNVISNTDFIIRRLINKKLGIKAKKKEIKSWSYSLSLGFDEKLEVEIFDELHAHYIDKLSLVKGAKAGLDYLNKHYIIWLITSRPIHTRSITNEWLLKKKIKFQNITFTNKKSKYFSQFKILFEDKTETALEFAEYGGHKLPRQEY